MLANHATVKGDAETGPEEHVFVVVRLVFFGIISRITSPTSAPSQSYSTTECCLFAGPLHRWQNDVKGAAQYEYGRAALLRCRKTQSQPN